MNLLLTRHQSVSLPIGPLNEVQCQTGSGLVNQLNIQLYTPVRANEITQFLCDSTLIKQHYGSVRLSWQARDTLTPINLLNQDFDVIMGREHSLKGLVPSFSQLYSPIIKFDGFSVYWFSRKAIEFSELEKLRIGLVEDPLSHTHYLLPLQDLKARSSNIDALDIHYYADNYSLYEAFDRREVDIISTIEMFRKGRNDGLHSVRITTDNSATLFVTSELSNAVRCELLTALEPVVEHLSTILNLSSVQTSLTGCN